MYLYTVGTYISSDLIIFYIINDLTSARRIIINKNQLLFLRAVHTVNAMAKTGGKINPRRALD